MRFRPGEQTLLTYDRVKPARVELILPVTVLEDTSDQTMVYLSAGTETQILVPTDGSTLPRNIPYSELGRIERKPAKSVWVKTNVLICWQAQWTWDVRLMWDSTSGEFLCWYVNIQDHIQRTDTGFRTTDHFVDIVVSPDSTWKLKDEAELNDAIELGLYTPDDTESICASLTRAIEHVESQGWPFNRSLDRLVPDQEWPLPKLLR